VCICHPRLEGKGGAEKWVLRMAQQYGANVYCTSYDKDRTFSGFKSINVAVIKNPLARFISILPKKVSENISFTLLFLLFKKPPGTDAILCCTSPAEFVSIRNDCVVWYCQSPSRLAYDAYSDKMSDIPLLKRPLYSVPIAIFRLLDRLAAKKAAKIFANSKNVQKRIEKYLGAESEVLYQGVDAEEFRFRKMSGFFLYPSRIAPYKRFEFAIEAFRIFKSRNPGSPYSLKIAGFLNGKSQEDLRYCRKISLLMEGLGEIVANPSDEAFRDLYGDCCCAIYSPKDEDFGLVPLEAAAAKKACIGVDEGGLRETIVDGKTGFLASSPEKMAEKIELMAKKPELFSSMGANARKNYEKRFMWKGYFSRLDSELLRLSEKKQKR